MTNATSKSAEHVDAITTSSKTSTSIRKTGLYLMIASGLFAGYFSIRLLTSSHGCEFGLLGTPDCSPLSPLLRQDAADLIKRALWWTGIGLTFLAGLVYYFGPSQLERITHRREIVRELVPAQPSPVVTAVTPSPAPQQPVSSVPASAQSERVNLVKEIVEEVRPTRTSVPTFGGYLADEAADLKHTLTRVALTHEERKEAEKELKEIEDRIRVYNRSVVLQPSVTTTFNPLEYFKWGGIIALAGVALTGVIMLLSRLLDR